MNFYRQRPTVIVKIHKTVIDNSWDGRCILVCTEDSEGRHTTIGVFNETQKFDQEVRKWAAETPFILDLSDPPLRNLSRCRVCSP